MAATQADKLRKRACLNAYEQNFLIAYGRATKLELPALPQPFVSWEVAQARSLFGVLLGLHTPAAAEAGLAMRSLAN